MKCSLGILCDPLRALGLHSHKAARRSTKRKTSRKVSKSSRSKKRR